MCEEMFASWCAQECHDPVPEADEVAMKSCHKELNVHFFFPDERQLWHERMETTAQ